MTGRLAAPVDADVAGAVPGLAAAILLELLPAAAAGLKNELVVELPPVLDIFGIGAERFLEGAPGLAALAAGVGAADEARAVDMAGGGGDRLAGRSPVPGPASSDLRFFGAVRISRALGSLARGCQMTYHLMTAACRVLSDWPASEH